MGRGDKKTAKGKRALGSYGNSRKKKTTKPSVAPVAKAEKKKETAEKKPATKKAAAKPAAEKKPAAKKAPAKKTTKMSEE
ncbi:MAG: 30S ribosomal protein THX [Cryomorphaceae bacterium]|jgi:ribosomal small subunit protein bTHX|nr:30S ribosomal protein THX [Cryomorphaceae bacterium]